MTTTFPRTTLLLLFLALSITACSGGKPTSIPVVRAVARAAMSEPASLQLLPSPAETVVPDNPRHDCRVIVAHLHLRAAASEISPVVGYLAQGDTLTLDAVAPVGNWVAVTAASQSGWVNSRYTNCPKSANQ